MQIPALDVTESDHPEYRRLTVCAAEGTQGEVRR
jgi:hypothetical protein